MSDNATHNIMTVLPTEILYCIFGFLPAKDLVKCRLVCQQWKLLTESLCKNEQIWRDSCKTDFKDVYKVARRKAKTYLSWHDIYKSLMLWPMIKCATLLKDEFAFASTPDEQIAGMAIVENGEVGVHTQTGVVYYDLDTLELSNRSRINGTYCNYDENPHCLVVMSFNLSLHVIRKTFYNSRYEDTVTFERVKYFILNDTDIHFITVDNKICTCDLKLDRLQLKFLVQCLFEIMCMSYREKLYFLTMDQTMLYYENGNLNLMCNLTTHCLDMLRDHNLLDGLDWRIYLQWLVMWNIQIPDTVIQDMTVTRVYGNVIIIGTNYGVLRLYYCPEDSLRYLLSHQPVMQWNFMERFDCPVLCFCPIVKIDVIECRNGHKIIVAMPKLVAVLHFVHSFKRVVSEAVFSPEDLQRCKVLRLDDETIDDS